MHSNGFRVPRRVDLRYDSNMCSSLSAGVEVDVASADTALTRALHDGVEHLGHDQLTALLGQLRVLTAKADALTLALVGRVDADGSYALDGALTAGGWLRAVAHQTPGQAARTVRTARTLRSGVLPNTTAALAAGAISGRHAAVIADGVKDAPAGAVALIEPEAVSYACEGDVRATAHLMRAFGQALDPDQADEKALRRYERAGVTFSPTARRRVRHHRHRRRDHRRRPRRRDATPPHH